MTFQVLNIVHYLLRANRSTKKICRNISLPSLLLPPTAAAAAAAFLAVEAAESQGAREDKGQGTQSRQVNPAALKVGRAVGQVGMDGGSGTLHADPPRGHRAEVGSGVTLLFGHGLY